MAGDWIKMRVNLRTDPTVCLIARETNASVYETIGRLLVFWAWADQHTDNGEIPWVIEKDVDALVEKEGFGVALQKAGWLMMCDHCIRLPNFDRHNGKSAKKRLIESERKRQHRAGQEWDSEIETCPVSVPFEAGQKTDKSVTREEKSNALSIAPSVNVIAKTVLKKSRVKIPDTAWLESLKADPTLAHVNIDVEFGALKRWCEHKGVQATQGRFLNWIARVDKPLPSLTSARPDLQMTF